MTGTEESWVCTTAIMRLGLLLLAIGTSIVHRSCIVFPSLYSKPRVARNGNKSEVNFRLWKNSLEIPRYKLYAISVKGKK